VKETGFVLTYVLDLIGVAVFSASGVLAARDRDLDVFGVITVATLTAIGGGTLRDLLLSRYPIFWVTDPWYLVVIIVVALLTMVYVKVRASAPGPYFLWADAFGLAFFTLSGASVAAAAHCPPLVVIVMGTMTGVTGGMLRDVVTAHVPLVMRREIYATAAIAGATIYLVLVWLSVQQQVAFIVGAAVVFVLRLLAIRYGLHLPSLRSE
jgi:uncharacterized membrane protein YeiH